MVRQGKEKQLLGALVKKYGDEPAAASDGEDDDDEDDEAGGGSDGGSSDEDDDEAAQWAWRLTRFYSKYNPDKVADVEKTLAKYAGKEELLFAALVKKYGPEPEDAGGVADVAAAAAGMAAASLGDDGEGEDPDGWTTRLTRFYALYNPEKVADVAKTLTKYAGNEDKLFDALVKKYGPEPPPPGAAAAGAGGGGGGDDDDDGEDATPFDANPALFRAVAYCPHSGLPPEYTEYSGLYESHCLPWLRANHPGVVAANEAQAAADEAAGKKKKKSKTSKHGGQAGVAGKGAGGGQGGGGKRGKKKKADTIEMVVVSRGGRKCMTHVRGLHKYDLGDKKLTLKKAAKALGRKFAGAASVKKTPSGQQEIVVQGDVTFDLPKYLRDEWGLPLSAMFVTDVKKKRSPAPEPFVAD